MTFVGMDLPEAKTLAAALGRTSGQWRSSARQLDASLSRTRWLGNDAATFKRAWTRHRVELGTVADALEAVRQSLLAEISEQHSASEGGGVLPVMMLDGGLASGGGGGGGSWGDSDRSRDPDGRDGRRVRNDDRVPGMGTENGGGGDLDNDWAGRAILERYLSGGDDWTIENDPTWTDYLQDNPSLTSQVARLTDEQARAAVQAYLRTGDATGSFATTTSVAIENGEGIVGYQYLHGTNADVGGFKHNGGTTVTPLSDGAYRVTVAASYQWNDVIDPNPQYSTDQRKSLIAEILTLGRADPYDLHIGWQSTTTLVVDAQGNVVSGQGWPK